MEVAKQKLAFPSLGFSAEVLVLDGVVRGLRSVCFPAKRSGGPIAAFDGESTANDEAENISRPKRRLSGRDVEHNVST